MSAVAWPSSDDRPRRAYRPGARERLLALLERVAAEGRPCPTNAALAAALGLSVEQAKVYVRRLAADGRIAVDRRRGPARVVTIVATGARTALPPPRLRLVAAPPAADPAPALRPSSSPRPVPPPVRFRCRSIADAPPEQLRTGCGWIEGDLPSGDWRYCNRPVEPGTNWCRHHYGRCYSPRPVPGAT